MLENIDKLLLYFLALFHGFITAYIVFVLTDLDFSEAYFVLFVIFCSLINVLLVRLLYASWLCFSLLWQQITPSCTVGPTQTANTRAKLSKALSLAPDDLLVWPGPLYFVFCVAVGIVSGYGLARAYQKDWILQAFSSVTGWPKDRGRNPMEQFFWEYCNRAPNTCSRVVLTEEEAKGAADRSDPDSKVNYEYMRIWWKDTKLVTAGFLAELPAKKDKPVVKLFAACEIVIKQDFSGESVYGTYTPNITQFVDLSNPNILVIEIVHKNPCKPQADSKR
jgi:hypothetical protein